MTWFKKFFSQPHQPFFTSGIIFFILYIFMLFLSYGGYLSLDKTILEYHAYPLIFIVFLQFFLGFLFTVFPRFLSYTPIAVKTYSQQFLFYFISSFGFFLSLIFFSKIVILFQVLLLFVQVLSFTTLYNIHKKSNLLNKEDTKWVLIGFLWGIISNLLFISSSLFNNYEIMFLSTYMGFYLFLLTIVFTISQRMIPFFTRAKLPFYMANKTKNLLLIFHILLVLKVLFTFISIELFTFIINLTLAIFVTREIIKWKLPSIFEVPAILWVLYISLYWLIIALILSTFESLSILLGLNIMLEKLSLHTLALGYFLTILLGFGSRVVLGHSGRKPYANKFTIFTFISVQALVLLRIFTSISLNFNLDYVLFIDLSSIVLILILLTWSSKYLPILLGK